MALDVVGIERLLDPDEVELFERAADPLRGRAVPLLVGIDHQRHAVAHDLPHRLEAAQVAHRVGRAHLDLDPADAARDRRSRSWRPAGRPASTGTRPRCCSTARNRGAPRAALRAAGRPAWPSCPRARRRTRRSPASPVRCGRPRRRPTPACPRCARCRSDPRRSGCRRSPWRARRARSPPARFE